MGVIRWDETCPGNRDSSASLFLKNVAFERAPKTVGVAMRLMNFDRVTARHLTSQLSGKVLIYLASE